MRHGSPYDRILPEMLAILSILLDIRDENSLIPCLCEPFSDVSENFPEGTVGIIASYGERPGIQAITTRPWIIITPSRD